MAAGEQEGKVLQAAALVATAAAAVAFVAGVGTYLYIRFTQGRRPPPGGQPPPERRPPA